MYLFFLFRVLFDEAKKRNFLLKSFLLSVVYFLLSMIIINYQNLFNFLLSNYDLFAKFKIITLLFIGSFQSIAGKDIILLIVTALLFGLNLELVLRKLKFIASQGSLHFTFGAGLITLAATGCASCGLSIASIVGLSAVLASLPFGGIELYIISITILLISLLYNLHTLVKVCKIVRI